MYIAVHTSLGHNAVSSIRFHHDIEARMGSIAINILNKLLNSFLFISMAIRRTASWKCRKEGENILHAILCSQCSHLQSANLVNTEPHTIFSAFVENWHRRL